MAAIRLSQQERNFLFFLTVALMLLIGNFAFPASSTSIEDRSSAGTCKRELENANRTISKWASNMEEMINEARLPTNARQIIHNEANAILDLIEDFGDQVASKAPNRLAQDLVSIRRRSNRLALDVYLATFDMRWPQNSLQMGVIVERVQQACLDRATIQALESPTSPLLN